MIYARRVDILFGTAEKVALQPPFVNIIFVIIIWNECIFVRPEEKTK